MLISGLGQMPPTSVGFVPPRFSPVNHNMPGNYICGHCYLTLKKSVVSDIIS